MLLSERVRIALADDITSGALEPGADLDEQELADRFGASRTPVREALRHLASIGLVEIRPRRGVVVASLSQDQIVDMFEVSAEIEVICVRLAVNRMNMLECSQLWRLHEESEAMIGNAAVDAYDRFNYSFHEAIYRATHNSFLAIQALALRERMAAFRRAQLRASNRTSQSRREHEDILNAMRRGDAEEAARCMRVHMSNAFSAFGRYLESPKSGGNV
jgi:DNA-binding GntR family transcriptional regulator